jgi:SH3-like domain-containing protein
MWQLTDLQNPDAPAPRYVDLRDASRAHRRAHPASRFVVRWVGAGPMPLETLPTWRDSAGQPYRLITEPDGTEQLEWLEDGDA